jgi:toxin FitB
VILLDTNVISEPLKPSGDPGVVAWIDEQLVETLYLSTVSVAELKFGVAVLPDGKRKEVLRASLDERVLPLFHSRILPLDMEAAEAYGALRARARAAGKALGVADSYIAAIAVSKGLIVATRDTQPFVAAGVPVINPWEEA